MKRKHWIILTTVLLVAAFSLLVFFDRREPEPYWGFDYDEAELGDPDLLGPLGGAWQHISQDLLYPEDWQRIVTNSPFRLGYHSLARTDSYDSGYTRNFYIGDLGSYPSLDGSTVAVPMAIEFARQHLALPEAALQTFVNFSTTHHAFEKLVSGDSGYAEVYLSDHRLIEPGYQPDASEWLNANNAWDDVVVFDDGHPVDLVIMTAPDAEELAWAAAAGVALIQEPVCHDAFVFLTHKDNPIESLTLEQIRGIYSGRISNWQQVGGPDLAIAAYQREAHSGSQTGMEQLVMQGLEMASPRTVKVALGMGMLIEAVAEYQNEAASLGYSYLYYIENLYPSAEIKVLAIDGIAPTRENIQSGRYPLSVNYYAVIRAEDAEQTGGQFLAWMLSPEGQACIAQAGYIPL